EPYVALAEGYGEAFAEVPSLQDFKRQLEFNIERLRQYKSGDRVIYERSPVDFLGYMLALGDLGREVSTMGLFEQSLAIVTDAVQLLDLIVFLPLDEEDAGMISDSE